MSKIEWTDETWNPISGCSKISTGCKNCYAERMSKRLAGRHGYPEAPHNFDVTWHGDKLEQPTHWRKPRKIFVCSMSDLFHEDVPLAYISDIFAVMDQCPQHIFQVLTKRPRRMADAIRLWYEDSNMPGDLAKNVWLGVTVCSQDEIWKIDRLLSISAAVRFVSLEPMLEMINLKNYLGIWTDGTVNPHQRIVMWEPMTPNLFTAMAKPEDATLYKKQLDWVIVGAETGPGARPMDLGWARSVRDQCQAAGIAFFFKRDSDGDRELDGRLWEEFPG